MKNGPYNLIVAPKGYPGKRYRGRYCYEHVYKYWSITGKLPGPGYEIHHKDHNHRNNNPWNLQLVTSNEHRKLHGHLNKLAHQIKTICGYCGVELSMRGNNYRSKMKNNKYGKVFCNRSCGAKHQYSGVAK